MSHKTVTWGEAIKHKYQNISENCKTDKKDKVASKLISNSMLGGLDNNSNDDFNNHDFEQDNAEDNSLLYTSDLQGAGVGHSIVCQVVPGHNCLF